MYEGFHYPFTTPQESYPVLTIQRPKYASTHVALVLGVLVAVLVSVSLPTSASAASVVQQPARAEVVAKVAGSSARPGVRAPSAARMQIIRSIPLYVSSGFDPRSHGFSFANWSSDTVETVITVDTLIRLFGQSSVCQAVASGTCIPFAKASALVDKLNEVLSTGRCEGMVALADELFRRPELVSSISTDATEISRLSPQAASDEIAYWWATQIIPRANESAKASRKMSPTRIVKTISHRIKNSIGGTLGLYYQDKGHAVLPIAVTRKGHIAKVSVYDSNTPNVVQTLFVNLRTDAWKYKAVAQDGTVLVDWHGRNAGGLDVVAPLARASQHVDSFSATTS